jgi:hypothetical protein
LARRALSSFRQWSKPIHGSTRSNISASTGAASTFGKTAGGGQELSAGDKQSSIWWRLTQWTMGQRPARAWASGPLLMKTVGPSAGVGEQQQPFNTAAPLWPGVAGRETNGSRFGSDQPSGEQGATFRSSSQLQSQTKTAGQMLGDERGEGNDGHPRLMKWREKSVEHTAETRSIYTGVGQPRLPRSPSGEVRGGNRKKQLRLAIFTTWTSCKPNNSSTCNTSNATPTD